MKLPGKPTTSRKNAADSIFVCVRVRPRNGKEKGSMPDVLKIMDDTTICFDPVPRSDSEWSTDIETDSSRWNILRTSGTPTHKNKIFRFDHVFGKHSTQPEVYNNTGSPIVESVLNGYNGTIFAYGATGSGKTYTMVGEDGALGIMVRTLNSIFQKIGESKDRQ